jgi:predicted alpha/beta hydrolase family esterase
MADEIRVYSCLFVSVRGSRNSEEKHWAKRKGRALLLALFAIVTDWLAV